MKIYVLGNPLLAEDSIPLKILPELKKTFPNINFQVVDPNENFPHGKERDLIILDTVINIVKPLILDLNKFEKKINTPISPHDYDLLFHLLMLKKLKKIDEVVIIGIPKKTYKNLFMDLEKIIKAI